jgi:CobN/Magnesium Chelatase
MVNEVVGTGDWEDRSSLGETWRGRNVFSYGRNEGGSLSSGTARPAVLDKLLETTERIVQEIDSVEYGLSDIQGRSRVPFFCSLPDTLTPIFYPQQNITQTQVVSASIIL